MRMQLSTNNSNPSIDGIIINIRGEEKELKSILSTKPINYDDLKDSLQFLAGFFVDLRKRMDNEPQWTGTNAEAYNSEVFELLKLCGIHFKGQNILDKVMPISFPIVRLNHSSQPPNPDPLVTTVPPSPASKVLRIVLFLGGGALTITGVASIAYSGVEIIGVMAAREAAKKAAEAVAKKAAEELAKKLLIKAAEYGVGGVVVSVAGGLTIWQGSNTGLPTCQSTQVPRPNQVVINP